MANLGFDGAGIALLGMTGDQTAAISIVIAIAIAIAIRPPLPTLRPVVPVRP
jgi:hypothetical protein